MEEVGEGTPRFIELEDELTLFFLTAAISHALLLFLRHRMYSQPSSSSLQPVK